MKPAQIVVDVVNAGGEIWAEEGRLMFRHAPARMIPLIREHKTELLALVASTPEVDYDAAKERIIAQRGIRLRPALRGATDAAPATSVQPEPSMPPQSAPATVTCGSCVRFQPGTTSLGVGVCLATANGLPPRGQRGYLAAYPSAPRRCPEFSGSTS